MKKLFFLGACLVVLASCPVVAQTPGGSPPPAAAGLDVVVVKVSESTAYLTLDIARADGKRERRDYKPRDLKENGNSAEFTRQLIAQLYQEGYALTSTYGGGGTFNLNTLVFTRRP